MADYKTQFGWPRLPNRDEALDLVYDFIRELGKKDVEKAGSLILVKDMDYFLNNLHGSLIKYLEMVLEDEEWESYTGRNLALEVDDPDILEENLTMPEFSGHEMLLGLNEDVSVQLGLRGVVTPIRLHFILVEADALYFLKLQRITAK